jgi:hypothetical protein
LHGRRLPPGAAPGDEFGDAHPRPAGQLDFGKPPSGMNAP